MKHKETRFIGQLLVQQNLITLTQLAQSLEDQKKSNRPLGSILIEMGAIDEETFYKVLAQQLNVEYVKLKSLNISPAAIQSIPAKYATHYKLVPIRCTPESITVATFDPLEFHNLDDLGLLLKKEINTVLASEKDILAAIKTHYGIGAETIEQITPESSPQEKLRPEAHLAQDIASSAEDASIIKFVNQILLEAYKDRATDLHIEPYESELRIRYRVDGILYDTKTPPNIKDFQQAIISRIKIMANLNIAEKRLPQDGRIKVKIADEEVDLRVSILPTSYGEAVVIRLLSTSVFFGLENLGLAKRDQETLEKLIRQPHGIIFVTGPTGSGKTTTLYAALSKINDSQKKIITIEDPIEYQIKHIVQMQVQPKIDLTFSQGLRSLLRHDPDIMMIGEVRDYETAEITIRVALTGHLVFSTLHTNDASGGIARLIDMGVEPFLVSSSVNAFVAQRLVRIICSACKEEITPNPEILREFGDWQEHGEPVKIFRGRGCEQCKHTGYRGRTAIYEILVINSTIREVILKRASSDEIKRIAVSDGMRTLRQDGWEKVKAGITTPEEVIRVTQQEELPE